MSSDQGCVDPQQVGSNDTIFSLRQVVDSLTDQDPATGELRPWLATSWESNADASAYTFTLREGVTFSDGTPLDAAAVRASFDAVPNLGARASLPKGYLAGYTGTTVESPTRFTMAFDGPNVQFLQGTSTHSLGILSPSTVAKSDDDDGVTLVPLVLPADLDVAADRVVPLLAGRGLLRTGSAGGSLRARFGLRRPANHFAEARA